MPHKSPTKSVMKLLATFLLALCATAAGAVVVPPVDPALHFHSSAVTAAPLGKNVTINGVLTYVSIPKKFDPSVAVLLLTDVFGLASPDNPILADQWAAAGFQVYAPDYLLGDPVTDTTNTTEWFTRHGEAQTTPPLLAVISALKAKGVKKIATTGYCFGGLYTVRLVQNNTIAVGTMAHPSLLTIPDDAELILSESRIPVSINNAELDTGLTPALAAEVDSVLGDGQYAPGYLRRQFNGVAHGFAVRANASDPVQVAAKQGAFDTSLAFFKKHLH
ncbi:Chlorocatechol-degradation protein [Mycena kentingensis (nom. inval.)]|nr:Chlorocatechol-degradation protein [Mycena kentingensis (nom. inval.)]